MLNTLLLTLYICVQGKTGFPWIDAIMVQLRQEGWIHHLARHAVGCFLTRGDLWISWEEGMKVNYKSCLYGNINGVSKQGHTCPCDNWQVCIPIFS